MRRVGTIDVFSAPTLYEGPGVINMYAQRSLGHAGREHDTASHLAVSACMPWPCCVQRVLPSRVTSDVRWLEMSDTVTTG